MMMIGSSNNNNIFFDDVPSQMFSLYLIKNALMVQASGAQGNKIILFFYLKKDS